MTTDTDPAGPAPPGRSRRRRVALAGAVVALVALLAVVVVPRLLPVHALVDVPDPINPGSPPNQPVGTSVSFGITGLAVRGHSPVHLLSARIIHVPAGLQAGGVQATNVPDRFGGTIGMTDDTPAGKNYLPLPPLYPVSSVHLEPGKTTNWYLIVRPRTRKDGSIRRIEPKRT
jgi:hypothetical protein